MTSIGGRARGARPRRRASFARRRPGARADVDQLVPSKPADVVKKPQEK
jgi:hypothetical protein